MKNSVLIILVAFILFPSLSVSLVAQDPSDDFSIEVFTVKDTVNFRCHKGCEWDSFSLPLKLNQIVPIDNKGIAGTQSIQSYQDENFQGFAFTMKKSETQLEFESVAGTDWLKLSVNYSVYGGHTFLLDRSGVIKLD